MSATLYNLKPLVFLRAGDEIHDRLDVHFNEPRWDRFDSDLEQVTTKHGFELLTEAVEKFNVGLTTAAKKFYCDEGIPFLRGENVYEAGIDLTSETFVPEEKHKEWISSQVKAGDIVINLVGNIGDACVIPDHIPEAQINRALGRIITNEREIDSRYLVEFLNSDLGKGQFIRYSQGGMQRRFNHPDGVFVKIPKCDRSTELCNRMNTIREFVVAIESLAGSIAQDRMKLLDSLLTIVAKQICLDSFPSPWFGRFYFKKTDSNIDRLDVLGANPDFEELCWGSGKFIPLKDICFVDGTNEQIPTGNQKYISIEGLSGADWRDVIPPEIEVEESTGRTHFYSGDIAWAHLKPSILQGKVFVVDEECWGSHHFLRIATSEVDEDLRILIWAYLKTTPIRRHLANKCTGKSESQKDVNDKALGMLPFPKLSDTQVSKAAQEVRGLIEKSYIYSASEKVLFDKSKELLKNARSNIHRLLEDDYFNSLVVQAEEALQ
ncbi:hypothetical protein ACK314_10670 [Aeromonas caviae]|uniref:hypothetical protein n=1 Tax=Aeromonas veronii TaxID=654 RepID=UPI00191E07A7|nr:hypothetical protein [Aeromonas veronii]MBL0622900.1 hypothetical protein [Aeromonas veronii]